MKKTNYPLMQKKCSVKFTSGIDPSVKIKDKVKVIREPKSRYKSTKSIEEHHQLSTKADEGSQIFAKPEFNSCLQYAKCILDLEEKGIQSKKYYSIDDLTPYEKKIVQKKISQKISFPPDVQIYKDLIPLEVPTDQFKELYCKSKKRKEYIKKDIIPKLSDFYIPKRKSEYKAIVDSPVVSEPPIREYNGMALHQKISSWHIE